MHLYRASWLLPVTSPPIRGGWVAVEGGRIAAFGGARESPGASGESIRRVDLGDAVIMPALVNAHTHLELSWLRGRCKPASTFLGWVSGMMRERLQSADGRDDGFRARRDGGRAGGDEARAARGSRGHHECARASRRARRERPRGHRLPRSDQVPRGGRRGVRRGVDAAGSTPSPRAAAGGWPSRRTRRYSVAPSVFGALAAARPGLREARMSVHVAESPEEVEFIGRGSGGWPESPEAPRRLGPRLAGPPVQPDRVPRRPGVLGRADARGPRGAGRRIGSPRSWRREA